MTLLEYAKQLEIYKYKLVQICSRKYTENTLKELDTICGLIYRVTDNITDIYPTETLDKKISKGLKLVIKYSLNVTSSYLFIELYTTLKIDKKIEENSKIITHNSTQLLDLLEAFTPDIICEGGKSAR